MFEGITKRRVRKVSKEEINEALRMYAEIKEQEEDLTDDEKKRLVAFEEKHRRVMLKLRQEGKL